MTTLNASQIYALARSAGFNRGEAVTATAIALSESKGDTAAVGDTKLETGKWGPSVGLWQIRSLKAESGKGTTRDATKLTDPAFNAKSAYEIYKGRGGWTDWSVFTSGAYKSNVTSVETTVGYQETSGGNAWWQVGWLDFLTPRKDGQTWAGAIGENPADTAADAVTQVTGSGETMERLNGLLANVSSGQWWTRIGIGAGGVLIILLAIVVMVWAGKDKILKSTVGAAVGSTVKAVKK